MNAANLVAWRLQAERDGQFRLCRGGEAFIANAQTAALFVALKNADSLAAAFALYLKACPSPPLDLATFTELGRRLESTLARARPEVPDATAMRWEFVQGATLERCLRPVAAVCTSPVLGTLALAAVLSFFAYAPPSVLGWLSSAQEQSNPWLLLVLTANLLVHESAHAVAALRNGVRLQGAGIGLSFIFPVAYIRFEHRAAVKRKAMLIIGSAGILGQLLLSGALLAVGGILSIPALTVAAELTAAMALIQLVPVFNTDGYWLLNDLLERRASNNSLAVGCPVASDERIATVRRVIQWIQIPLLGAAIYGSAPDVGTALRWMTQVADAIATHRAPWLPDRAAAYGIFVSIVLFALCVRLSRRGIRSFSMGQRRAGGSRQP